jgi:phosphatidylglycerol---prolipoprotein diacylglyceryl transferase
MTHALHLTWNPSEGIDLGFFMIRYYSLMFVIAFLLGWYITKPIFKRENESIEKLDSLFFYMFFAILFGARLGHVLFYQSELIFDDPLSVLLPISTKPKLHFTGFAGLASHGAAIAVIIAMYFYQKNVLQRPWLWILDRVVIPVASGAVFVRLGNFINSEIYGHTTNGDSFYAIKFIRETEFWGGNDQKVMDLTQAATPNEAYKMIQTDPKFIDILNQIPFRHPSQLYEGFCYIFVFLILFFAYWKTDASQKQGFLFGLFLVLLFTVRFIVEFVKESQGGFESELGLFSTGQWLSIPFIFIGLYFVLRPKKSL